MDNDLTRARKCCFRENNLCGKRKSCELCSYMRNIKKLSYKVDDDTKKICETTHLLQSQIQLLYNKWKYTEESANGNG